MESLEVQPLRRLVQRLVLRNWNSSAELQKTKETLRDYAQEYARAIDEWKSERATDAQRLWSRAAALALAAEAGADDAASAARTAAAECRAAAQDAEHAVRKLAGRANAGQATGSTVALLPPPPGGDFERAALREEREAWDRERRELRREVDAARHAARAPAALVAAAPRNRGPTRDMEALCARLTRERDEYAAALAEAAEERDAAEDRAATAEARARAGTVVAPADAASALRRGVEAQRCRADAAEDALRVAQGALAAARGADGDDARGDVRSARRDAEAARRAHEADAAQLRASLAREERRVAALEARLDGAARTVVDFSARDFSAWDRNDFARRDMEACAESLAGTAVELSHVLTAERRSAAQDAAAELDRARLELSSLRGVQMAKTHLEAQLQRLQAAHSAALNSTKSGRVQALSLDRDSLRRDLESARDEVDQVSRQNRILESAARDRPGRRDSWEARGRDSPTHPYDRGSPTHPYEVVDSEATALARALAAENAAFKLELSTYKMSENTALSNHKAELSNALSQHKAVVSALTDDVASHKAKAGAQSDAASEAQRATVRAERRCADADESAAILQRRERSANEARDAALEDAVAARRNGKASADAAAALEVKLRDLEVKLRDVQVKLRDAEAAWEKRRDSGSARRDSDAAFALRSAVDDAVRIEVQKARLTLANEAQTAATGEHELRFSAELEEARRLLEVERGDSSSLKRRLETLKERSETQASEAAMARAVALRQAQAAALHLEAALAARHSAEIRAAENAEALKRVVAQCDVSAGDALAAKAFQMDAVRNADAAVQLRLEAAAADVALARKERDDARKAVEAVKRQLTDESREALAAQVAGVRRRASDDALKTLAEAESHRRTAEAQLQTKSAAAEAEAQSARNQLAEAEAKLLAVVQAEGQEVAVLRLEIASLKDRLVSAAADRDVSRHVSDELRRGERDQAQRCDDAAAALASAQRGVLEARGEREREAVRSARAIDDAQDAINAAEDRAANLSEKLDRAARENDSLRLEMQRLTEGRLAAANEDAKLGEIRSLLSSAITRERAAVVERESLRAALDETGDQLERVSRRTSELLDLDDEAEGSEPVGDAGTPQHQTRRAPASRDSPRTASTASYTTDDDVSDDGRADRRAQSIGKWSLRGGLGLVGGGTPRGGASATSADSAPAGTLQAPVGTLQVAQWDGAHHDDAAFAAALAAARHRGKAQAAAAAARVTRHGADRLRRLVLQLRPAARRSARDAADKVRDASDRARDAVDVSARAAADATADAQRLGAELARLRADRADEAAAGDARSKLQVEQAAERTEAEARMRVEASEVKCESLQAQVFTLTSSNAQLRSKAEALSQRRAAVEEAGNEVAQLVDRLRSENRGLEAETAKLAADATEHAADSARFESDASKRADAATAKHAAVEAEFSKLRNAFDAAQQAAAIDRAKFGDDRAAFESVRALTDRDIATLGRDRAQLERALETAARQADADRAASVHEVERLTADLADAQDAASDAQAAAQRAAAFDEAQWRRADEAALARHAVSTNALEADVAASRAALADCRATAARDVAVADCAARDDRDARARAERDFSQQLEAAKALRGELQGDVSAQLEAFAALERDSAKQAASLISAAKRIQNFEAAEKRVVRERRAVRDALLRQSDDRAGALRRFEARLEATLEASAETSKRNDEAVVDESLRSGRRFFEGNGLSQRLSDFEASQSRARPLVLVDGAVQRANSQVSSIFESCSQGRGLFVPEHLPCGRVVAEAVDSALRFATEQLVAKQKDVSTRLVTKVDGDLRQLELKMVAELDRALQSQASENRRLDGDASAIAAVAVEDAVAAVRADAVAKADALSAKVSQQINALEVSLRHSRGEAAALLDAAKEQTALVAEQTKHVDALDGELIQRRSESIAQAEALRASAAARVSALEVELFESRREAVALAEAASQRAAQAAEHTSQAQQSLELELESSRAEASSLAEAAQQQAQRHALYVEALTSDVAQKRSEVVKLGEELEAVKFTSSSEIEAATIAFAQKHRESLALSAELEATKEASSSDVEALAGEVARLRIEAAALDEEVETTKSKVEALSSDVSKRRSESARLGEELEATKSKAALEVEALQGDVAKARSVALALGAELEGVKEASSSDVEALTLELEQQRLEASALGESFRSAQEKLTSSQGAREVSSRQLAALALALETQQRVSTALTAELDSVRAEGAVEMVRMHHVQAATAEAMNMAMEKAAAEAQKALRLAVWRDAVAEVNEALSQMLGGGAWDDSSPGAPAASPEDVARRVAKALAAAAAVGRGDAAKQSEAAQRDLDAFQSESAACKSASASEVAALKRDVARLSARADALEGLRLQAEAELLEVRLEEGRRIEERRKLDEEIRLSPRKLDEERRNDDAAPSSPLDSRAFTAALLQLEAAESRCEVVQSCRVAAERRADAAEQRCLELSRAVGGALELGGNKRATRKGATPKRDGAQSSLVDLFDAAAYHDELVAALGSDLAAGHRYKAELEAELDAATAARHRLDERLEQAFEEARDLRASRDSAARDAAQHLQYKYDVSQARDEVAAARADNARLATDLAALRARSLDDFGSLGPDFGSLGPPYRDQDATRALHAASVTTLQGEIDRLLSENVRFRNELDSVVDIAEDFGRSATPRNASPAAPRSARRAAAEVKLATCEMKLATTEREVVALREALGAADARIDLAAGEQRQLEATVISLKHRANAAESAARRAQAEARAAFAKTRDVEDHTVTLARLNAELVRKCERLLLKAKKAPRQRSDAR
ncbi:hypothetical protein M885DRAFT_610746 [Pelagophyceae sp. CCMP2097]|nr:hypothetical protein M885DRAFT_610746 [Pelagophyceae sp. CCMP2097]